ncbi:MAG TPA: saccharopine dehydrogenase C-terminal domain-containing protein [Phycisphaerales bacterium]|nr:saccharopine dehydrogenase C-terminal domain-containing protein [Phycisphaerales bacterium]HMP38316.1 saccharopine dehydrogenase C-terminal domain-containing protein [Phycisphaerales bacterium]
MPTKALVLGSGLVGGVMAADLLATRGVAVSVADQDAEALERTVAACRRTAQRAPRIVVADLSEPAEIRRLAEEHDIVVGALASHLAFAALRAVLEAGRPCADIAFMAEDALELDAFARRRGVTAIVDCGVAPGMSNLLAGVAARRLRPCERIEIVVGGLPVERRMPFQYKAGFAPADVIEEYTRPARIVEDGKLVVRPALSGREIIELPGVGSVEAFNTDGLRSLASTLKVPAMRERTLRWPGHVEAMLAFREAGFFSTDPIRVGDMRVVPREVTAALLFPKWSYEPGEADLTVMRVVGEGRLDGVPARLTWDLLDFLDRESGFTSMARTTAFPCTLVARELAAGRLRRPGVAAPEALAADEELVERILQGLRKRGVRFELSAESIDEP